MTLRRLLTALLAITVVPAVVSASGCGGDKPTPEPFGERPAKQKVVSSVKLSDVSTSDDGPLVAPVPGRGELMLVSFGFTSCPDICPTTLADLGTAIRSLPANDRGRVTTAMITVDPKRDTGKTMRSYLKHFFDDDAWLALRTDDDRRLSAAEQAFGASHELGKQKRDGEYNVSHTAYTYVVNDSGEVVLEWPFGMRSDEIAHDLKLLLAGAGANADGEEGGSKPGGGADKPSVTDAWARTTPEGAHTGAIYMTIKGTGATDRLIEARVAQDLAGDAQIHEVSSSSEMSDHSMDGDSMDHGSMGSGRMQMREVEGIDIPPDGSVTLKPGGYHVMLLDLKRQIEDGERIAVTLTFEKAGKVTVVATASRSPEATARPPRADDRRTAGRA